MQNISFCVNAENETKQSPRTSPPRKGKDGRPLSWEPRSPQRGDGRGHRTVFGAGAALSQTPRLRDRRARRLRSRVLRIDSASGAARSAPLDSISAECGTSNPIGTARRSARNTPRRGGNRTGSDRRGATSPTPWQASRGAREAGRTRGDPRRLLK